MPSVSLIPRQSSSLKAKPHGRSVAFFTLCSVVVLVAGISLYLELKIRSTAAQLEKLVARATLRQAGNNSRHAARETNLIPMEQNVSVESAGRDERTIRKWRTDSATLEQQWKQAVAALGPDLVIINGAKHQLQTRLRFQELYRILGLSDAEIIAFENEAAARNLSFAALVSLDPKSVEAHQRSQAKSMDRVVEAALGKEYVEPFRLFHATSDLRDMTTDLAAISLSAGEPLGTEEAATLLQTCLDFSQPRNGATKIGLDQIDWDSVVTKSEKFLTPAQQKLLRALVDKEAFQKTLRDVTGLPLHRPVRGLSSR